MLGAQSIAANHTDLDRDRVCGLVVVQEVAEVQRAWCRGCFALDRSVSATLFGPTAIEGSILAEDVWAELST